MSQLFKICKHVNGSINRVSTDVYAALKKHGILNTNIVPTKRGSQGIRKRRIPVLISESRPSRSHRSAIYSTRSNLSNLVALVNNNHNKDNNVNRNNHNITSRDLPPECPQRKQQHKKFSMCCLNPWSVCNKAISIQDFTIDHDLDILCLTETWLTGSESDNPVISAMLPNGYSIQHHPRPSRGGGTAVIHRSSLRIRSMDPPRDFDSFETTNCMLITTQCIRLCVIYRPPPSTRNGLSVKKFMEEFTELMQHLVISTAPLLLLGDFNFHVNNANDRDASAFLELVSSFGLQQHVTQTTHRNGHTLDLVFTRSTDSIMLSTKAEDHGFPDHFPVFMNLAVPKPELPKQSVSYRKIKDIQPSSLHEVISNSRLCVPSTAALPLNELTMLYNTELDSIINKLAPLKTRTITIRPQADWYNSSIREAKQRRRRAERQWRKSGLSVHRGVFIECREEVNALVTEAKQSHFRSLVTENKGNTKQLFNVVNTLLGRKVTAPMPADKSPSELASMFNDFFVQKIQKIRNSINSDSPAPDVPSPAVTCSLSTFQPLTIEQVEKLITASTNKSCDLDPLPTSFVKMEVKTLAPVICAIVNKSLETGDFPQMYKSAVVSPLLKKASLDPEELKNYRPVSNLAFISKLIERVAATQLQSYLSSNNLLEPFQSAYRQGHSTETALLRVHNDVLCAVGKKQAILLLLLDLSAAFDTVDHQRLLQTLGNLGISGTALMWFKSYLSSRSQVIRIKGAKSDAAGLDCGVPQGSVLGPILFTIYTSSLGALLRHNSIHYHLYADDSELYLSCKINELDSAISRMESCLSSVQTWMAHHYLKMNDDKTELLLISSKQVAQRISIPFMQVGSHSIIPTPTAKCIGVTMDSHLSMTAHISSVCRSSYYHLRNIGYLKRYLDQESLECVVHAFITSKLDYCNALYTGLPSSQISRLQSIQNAAARILTGSRKYDHITPVLRSLHWLPVQQRIKFKSLVIVYKTVNGMSPGYLQELLQPYVPPRNLRSQSCHLLTVPFTNSNLVMTRAFSYYGPRLWNELPQDFKSTPSLNVFKRKLKTHLFIEYFG